MHLCDLASRSEDGQEVILEVCGDSRELASRQLGFFFPSFDFSTGTMGKKDSRTQRTVALIRPSLVKEKKGDFEITFNYLISVLFSKCFFILLIWQMWHAL